MLTAITGINWGDEGKGRMVDLISQEYDIVARYQGGNNAGHTVKNERGKFVLNLLPSGILRPNVVCVMGNGMVIDPHHLDGEINKLREQGVEITPANLKISDRATITMPYHVEQDGLEEARLSKTGAQFGSTKRGIAYTYGDKYMKKTLRMGDLLHLDNSVKKRLVTMVDSKNLVMEGSYNAAPISVDEMWAWLEKYAAIFKDYICDAGQYLADADAAGKKILFEAQLGALRDIDFGIYPYTTSSNVIGAYAPIGAGIPGHKLHNSIGVMKAYSSCVGDGPFVTELAMTEEEKHALREAGHEYGAATGRPRRGKPLRRLLPGLRRGRPDPAGRAGLHGEDPHGHRLQAGRRHHHHPLPHGRGAGYRTACGRVPARLALRHHRCPQVGGSAQGGSGLR